MYLIIKMWSSESLQRALSLVSVTWYEDSDISGINTELRSNMYGITSRAITAIPGKEPYSCVVLR